jgi:RNA polymerase sigma factor (sigma-70 family)
MSHRVGPALQGLPEKREKSVGAVARQAPGAAILVGDDEGGFRPGGATVDGPISREEFIKNWGPQCFDVVRRELRRYARRFPGRIDGAEAEDFVQEIMVRVATRDCFATIAKPLALVNRLARQLILDAVRREIRTRRILSRLDPPADGTQDREEELRAAREDVAELLSMAGEREREWAPRRVAEAFLRGDGDLGETAKLLGKKPGYVSVNLIRLTDWVWDTIEAEVKDRLVSAFRRAVVTPSPRNWDSLAEDLKRVRPWSFPGKADHEAKWGVALELHDAVSGIIYGPEDVYDRLDLMTQDNLFCLACVFTKIALSLARSDPVQDETKENCAGLAEKLYAEACENLSDICEINPQDVDSLAEGRGPDEQLFGLPPRIWRLIDALWE